MKVDKDVMRGIAQQTTNEEDVVRGITQHTMNE
jgi:hypothetical protein